MINRDDIICVAPQCRFPEEWVRPLNQAMDRFGISESVPRAAAFLGQVAYESQQLNVLQENLNYAPQRIVAVWPTRFPTLESALPFGRNPEKLANRVYADRLGNNKESSGDGFRYRGRGLLQITGRANYEEIGKRIDMPTLIEMPDYLVEHRHAAMSAAAFWDWQGLNELADTYTGKNLKRWVRAITKKVSGSYDTAPERTDFTRKALWALDKEMAA